jgi:hypothetical protein
VLDNRPVLDEYSVTATMESKSAVRALSALAQDSRLEVYRLLVQAGPDGMAARQEGHAKWMLEDPRVNFAISMHHQPIGVNHLGFQVESDEELRGMQAQLQAADSRMVQEDEQPCCYARSDKYWVTDPSGIAWETFHTLANIPVYGEDTPVFDHDSSAVPVRASKCCAPNESAT